MSQNEENIRFGDLIYGIVRKWKPIVFGAVIFAVLLSAFKYKQDWNNYIARTNQKNTALSDNVKLNLTQSEIFDIEECILIENEILELREFLNYGENMQDDPFRLEIYRLQYYIKTTAQNTDETLEETIDIGNLYKQNILTQENVKKITETLQLKENDFLNYVDVSCSDSGAILNVDLLLPQDTNVDKELFLKTIEEIISDVSETLTKVCEHEIEKVSQIKPVILNTEYAEAHIRRISQIQTLQNFVDSKKAKFTEQQLNYYQSLTEGESSFSENTDDLLRSPSINVKYLVVGFFAGFLLMCFFIAYFILASNKLLNIETIKNRSGVKTYGILHTGKNKRIRRNLSFSKDDISLEALTSFIRLDCEKEEASELIMLGTALSDANIELISPILNSLTEAGINVIVKGNIVQNPGILEGSMKENKIIIVEHLFESYCNMIYKELNILRDYNFRILGAFVIDNR